MGYALWDSGSSGQPCFLPLGNYVIHERSFSHHLPYDFVRSGSENLLSDPLLLRKIHRNHLPGHILLILGYGLYIEGNLDLVDKLAAPEILEFYGVPATTSEPKKIPQQKPGNQRKRQKKAQRSLKKRRKLSV